MSADGAGIIHAGCVRMDSPLHLGGFHFCRADALWQYHGAELYTHSTNAANTLNNKLVLFIAGLLLKDYHSKKKEFNLV